MNMDSRLSNQPDEPFDRLFVAMSDTTGLARVQGRGNYKISPILKEFAARMLDEGRLQLVVDLKDCEGMDSTFMGTLAGISQRCQKAGGDSVVMTSVSPKLEQLMKTLGLNRLVRVQKASWKEEGQQEEPLTELPAAEASPLESAEHILEAHETLVEISPDNFSRFEDCLHFLREDVRNRKS